VGLQVAARVELEVAGRARVRFVAGVGPLVDEQLPAAGKGLSAVVAVVRLLAGVRSTVKAEAFFDREALVADGALVRHLAGVGSHVDRQTSHLDELNENEKTKLGLNKNKKYFEKSLVIIIESKVRRVRKTIFNINSLRCYRYKNAT
jgi:hypothetical protein